MSALSLSKEAFDTNRGLWLATAQQELYPAAHSYAREGKSTFGFGSAFANAQVLYPLLAHQLNWYRFIGRVLGKALYEGILIEVAFASFFLGKVSLPPPLTFGPQFNSCLYNSG